LESQLPQWVAFYLPAWLLKIRFTTELNALLRAITNLLVAVSVVIFLIRGKFKGFRFLWNFVSNNRFRFFGCGMLFLVIEYGAYNLFWATLPSNQRPGNFFIWYFVTIGFPLFWLIALITWLIRPQNRPTPKRA
jgi:hypothetical protein